MSGVHHWPFSSGIKPPIPNLYRDSEEGDRKFNIPEGWKAAGKSRPRARAYSATQATRIASTKEICSRISSAKNGSAATALGKRKPQ